MSHDKVTTIDNNNASKCTVDYSGTLADLTPKNGNNKYTVLSEQSAPEC